MAYQTSFVMKMETENYRAYVVDIEENFLNKQSDGTYVVDIAENSPLYISKFIYALAPESVVRLYESCFSGKSKGSYIPGDTWNGFMARISVIIDSETVNPNEPNGLFLRRMGFAVSAAFGTAGDLILSVCSSRHLNLG